MSRRDLPYFDGSICEQNHKKRALLNNVEGDSAMTPLVQAFVTSLVTRQNWQSTLDGLTQVVTDRLGHSGCIL